MPKRIGNELYYSLSEAAKRLQLSRHTLFRWVIQGVPGAGFPLAVLRDPISSNYYLAEASVKALAARFEPVTPPALPAKRRS